jgi:two-component system sensor histidine kinase KdpD
VAQSDVAGSVRALAEQVRLHLHGALDVLVAGEDGKLTGQPALNSDWLKSEKERAVSLWAFEHQRRAGWSTDTLPMAAALSLPLVGPSGHSVGVLAFKPERDLRLSQDDENLLSAIAHQLALSFEREHLRGEVEQAERLRESERLLSAVVDSVSHELRTPLTAIAGTAAALGTDQVAADPVRRRELCDELLATSERLNRVVGNLLDMSRFSAGAVTMQRDWHDVGDLLRSAQAATARELKNHAVTLRHDEHLPLVRVDHRLFEQALANLLSNAAMHTPAGTAVELEAWRAEGRLGIRVADRGPGFPEAAMPSLFNKFFRAEGTPSGGVGLGLAITKAIVEAHGGTVSASNRAHGGACVTISLPMENQPSVPVEEEDT